jgi:predicted RNA-binding protein
MTYWLIVTIRENWDVIKEKQVVGISERYKNWFLNVQKGDKCLFYIRREYIKRENKPPEVAEPAVSGVFEVISTAYDNQKIFAPPPTRQNETFPLRLNLNPVGTPAEPIPFKPLVTQLSFIVHPKSWGNYLQGRTLIPLSERDFATIVSALQKER